MTESGNIPDPLKELRSSQAHFVALRDGMNGRLVFRKRRGDNHLVCRFPMNSNRGHHQHIAPTPWSSSSWEPNKSLASQEIPPHFMKHEGSLPHSQQPATCPYPKPDKSSTSHLIPLLEDPFQYYLRLGPPRGNIPSDFPTKILCPPLLSPTRAKCPRTSDSP